MSTQITLDEIVKSVRATEPALLSSKIRQMIIKTNVSSAILERKTNELLAENFYQNFPDMIEHSLLKRIQVLEGRKNTNKVLNEMEEQWEQIFDGLLPVCDIHDNASGTDWFDIAIKKIIESGWNITTRKGVIIDPGISSKIVLYLCIPDPLLEFQKVE